MMRRAVLAVTIVLAGLTLVVAVGFSSCGSPSGGRQSMEMHDDRLRPCPSSPNCVGSQDEPGPHHVEPLAFEGPPDAALAALRALIEAWPRAEIVESDARYLHATFRTRWLRFVDDVEFLLDPQAGVIHLRSASRLGYSDLGTNRRRVEELRAAWDARR